MSTSTVCQQVWDNGLEYLESSIDSMGILLNALCVACFAQILIHKDRGSSNNSQKGNMFKFFFVKAVCDLILHSGDIIDMLTFWCATNCNMHSVSWFWYYWTIFSWDCEFILMTMSLFMEIAATLGKKLQKYLNNFFQSTILRKITWLTLFKAHICDVLYNFAIIKKSFSLTNL
jgi:hypothetical protein